MTTCPKCAKPVVQITHPFPDADCLAYKCTSCGQEFHVSPAKSTRPAMTPEVSQMAQRLTHKPSTTMRTITDHKLNGLNDALTITVLDEPGQGGACHEYAIDLGPRTNEAENETVGHGSCHIHFQNGPIKEAGVNGISGEALLAIVIDRLRSFQSGPFACRDNAVALTKLEESLMWLQKRTRDRLARGVEGTNQK